MRTSPIAALLLTLGMALFLAPAQADDSSSSQVEFDTWALTEALTTLDHYMNAGGLDEPERGASFLVAFDMQSRRAIYNTKRLYKKHKVLFTHYLSISNDLYGYEVNSGFLGTTVILEGAIRTEEGLTGEFKAELTYSRKRWLISNLAIY